MINSNSTMLLNPKTYVLLILQMNSISIFYLLHYINILNS